MGEYSMEDHQKVGRLIEELLSEGETYDPDVAKELIRTLRHDEVECRNGEYSAIHYVKSKLIRITINDMESNYNWNGECQYRYALAYTASDGLQSCLYNVSCVTIQIKIPFINLSNRVLEIGFVKNMFQQERGLTVFKWPSDTTKSEHENIVNNIDLKSLVQKLIGDPRFKETLVLILFLCFSLFVLISVLA